MSTPDEFHKHLDECPQCMNNPFKLCLKGHLLLTGLMDEPLDSEFSKFVTKNFLKLIYGGKNETE
jgi:hypothetical protein